MGIRRRSELECFRRRLTVPFVRCQKRRVELNIEEEGLRGSVRCEEGTISKRIESKRVEEGTYLGAGPDPTIIVMSREENLGECCEETISKSIASIQGIELSVGLTGHWPRPRHHSRVWLVVLSKVSEKF